MQTIHVLSGLSGVGKTHFYKQHLSDLKLIDIAEYYKSNPTGGPGDALQWLVSELINHLENSTDDIVLEAYFKEGSTQREWIHWVEINHPPVQIKYIELSCPDNVRRERILNDYKNACQSEDSVYLYRRTQARLRYSGLKEME